MVCKEKTLEELFMFQRCGYQIGLDWFLNFKEDFYANENPCTLMGIIAQNEGENEKENENVR